MKFWLLAFLFVSTNAVAVDKYVTHGGRDKIVLTDLPCTSSASGMLLPEAVQHFKAARYVYGDGKTVDGCYRPMDYQGQQVVVTIWDDSDKIVLPLEVFRKVEML